VALFKNGALWAGIRELIRSMVTHPAQSVELARMGWRRVRRGASVAAKV